MGGRFGEEVLYFQLLLGLLKSSLEEIFDLG